MNNLLYAFIFFSFYLNASSHDILKKIVIEGNKKTKDKIILNESDLKIGEKITKTKIEEAKRKILNLLIFSSVDIKQEKSIVKIKVKERWTTIPILKFSSGGGVSELIVGIFDVNLFGNYVEAGAQYQRLGEKNSGVTWLKIPRISQKVNFEFQAWKFNRIRIKYDQTNENPIVTNGFTQSRDKIFSSFGYRPSYEQEFKLFYEYNFDDFTNDLQIDDFDESNVVLAPSSTFHFVGTNFQIGKVNNNLEMNEGHEALIQYKYGISSKAKNFHEATFKFLYFKKFKKIFNYGTRFFLGFNNSQNIQHLFYFGGLDSIRGFADNRLSGQNGFYLNNEIRTTLLKKKSYVLQANNFVDIGNTSKDISDLSKNIALSAGVGFRVVLPKFYRFVIRADYAKTFLKNDDNNISFGVQQFF